MRSSPCRPRRPAVLTMMVVLGIITATAVAHVWTHLQVIEYGYEISKATRLRDELLERNRRLRVDLAVLKDPARVARVAAEKFGLRPSEPGQVRRLRLRDGGELPLGPSEAHAVASRQVDVAEQLWLAERPAGSALHGERGRPVR